MVGPEDRARRGACGTQDAFGRVVVARPLLGALQALTLGRRAAGDEPGLDRGVAREERLHVDDEVLLDGHPPERFHRDRLGEVTAQDLAGEAVVPVDDHGVGAADPVGARAPEREGAVDVPLHEVEGVEDAAVVLHLRGVLAPPRPVVQRGVVPLHP